MTAAMALLIGDGFMVGGGVGKIIIKTELHLWTPHIQQVRVFVQV
jgi:hypothetical protein